MIMNIICPISYRYIYNKWNTSDITALKSANMNSVDMIIGSCTARLTIKINYLQDYNTFYRI